MGPYQVLFVFCLGCVIGHCNVCHGRIAMHSIRGLDGVLYALFKMWYRPFLQAAVYATWLMECFMGL